ncbi:nose resistant to fluoxetine protein 6-like [Drosophila kikkawai]|uniref:Nose resistant to fluoxetine protein 6-like n=1 Tax=Drosophila kikkawai TaxID=30033 RepID=A0A6P4J0V1_DROKI|nr:nose resistant to fluoxetine protein 6-like [Drosophila kikkawai]
MVSSVSRAALPLLICLAAVAQATLPTRQIPMEDTYHRHPNASYERLLELPSLGPEFYRQFRNISASDLHLLDGRLNQQDLVCLADLAQFMGSLASPKLWALSMLDSWGSKPSGFLYGNRVDMGNYEQCLRVDGTISETHHIKGKYCFLELPIAKWLGFNSDFLAETNIKTAVCFPSSCSAETMEVFLKQLLQRLLGTGDLDKLFYINEQSCQTSESDPLDGLTIFTIVFLSIFCAVVALCTLYDYFLCPDQGKLPRLVKVFSARATSRELFAIVDPKATPNVIQCLNGMRCLSLIWVVLGHEYIINIMAMAINQVDNLRWMGKPFSSLILFAPFSVDTFFFLSGFLLVAIGLRALEKSKGRLNVPLMYLHRYLRLTPIVAVAILVYMKVLPLLAAGPMYEKAGFFDYSLCKDTWYWTLLYVQNYATTDVCLEHTWYLAVDMQLYLLAPILLIVLYKWGKKGAAAILLVMLLLSACLFATIMTNDYKILFKNGGQLPDVAKKIYSATHTHAAPWLVGTLFGYFMHLVRGKQLRLNGLAVWTGWLLCLAMIFTSLFAMFPYAKLLGPSPTVLEGALYYTLTRIGWPLALCWVVFACVQGYGGLANSFLSSPLWQPLSRLSYSAYVWHIFIQEVNHRRVRSNTYFSDYDVMCNFWATFGFTLLMAYVMYVVVEAPLGGLEGLLMPSRKSPGKQPPAPAQEELHEEQKEPQRPEFSQTEDTEAVTSKTAAG